MISDLAAEQELNRNDIERLRAKNQVKSVTQAGTGVNVNWLKPEQQLFQVNSDGSDGYSSSYTTLDLSAYIGQTTQSVLLEIDLDTNRASGSADSRMELLWLTDHSTTPKKLRYYDSHSLVEAANYNNTFQVTWPVNSDGKIQYKIYNGTNTNDRYTVRLEAWIG